MYEKRVVKCQGRHLSGNEQQRATGRQSDITTYIGVVLIIMDDTDADDKYYMRRIHRLHRQLNIRLFPPAELSMRRVQLNHLQWGCEKGNHVYISEVHFYIRLYYLLLMIMITVSPS